MTLEEILELMSQRNFDVDKFKQILTEFIPITNKHEASKEYHQQLHKIHDKTHRPDKMIGGGTDDGDSPADREAQRLVKVARLGLAYQKKIVLLAGAFIGMPEIDCTPANDDETNLLAIIEQICETAKLEYKFAHILEYVMSERHCAELWFTQDVTESYWGSLPIDSNVKLSMRLLANSLGDELFPVFDEYDNMIAFGRGYIANEIIDGKVEKVSHFDIYTEDEIYRAKEFLGVWIFLQAAGGEWAPDFTALPNPIGKIPVIYYGQQDVEWADVQGLIERTETKISNHADTNDYFDSPVILATGAITGFVQKDESGKLLQADNGATVEYITWDSAPASMKMELDNLKYFIHSLSHTPDITFEQIQGLGKLSGVAIRLLFLDADLKARKSRVIYGEGIRRRLNLLKTTVAILDKKYAQASMMKMSVNFTDFLQEDTSTVITTLAAATAAGILSQETAIEQNPMVVDADAEKERIKTEQENAAAQAIALVKASKPDPAAGQNNPGESGGASGGY